MLSLAKQYDDLTTNLSSKNVSSNNLCRVIIVKQETILDKPFSRWLSNKKNV